MPAIAHDPTPNRDGDGYTGSQTLRRVWNADPSPPSWVKTGVDLAIDHAPSSVAGIPTFSTSSGISGPVYYRTRADSPCTGASWACADNNIGEGNNWRMTFLRQGQAARSGSVDWCEYHSPDATSGCVRADRVAIHELGHVLDLDHYPGDASVNSDTVMRSTTPNVNYTGGQATYFRTCDKGAALHQARAQQPEVVVAGLPRRRGGRVPGVGMDTIVGLDITDESPCRYQSAAFSGYLKTNHVSGQYSNTSAKPLEDRTVELQRKEYGSSGGFETVHSSDETSSNGYFYITHEFIQTGAWIYHARFGGEEGLSGDLSSDHVVNILPC